jgi:repressor LexA
MEGNHFSENFQCSNLSNTCSKRKDTPHPRHKQVFLEHLFAFFPDLGYPFSMAKKPTSSSKPSAQEELTVRQAKILQVIKDSVDKNGYAPSMREIGLAAGLASPASVKYQLEILAEKGLIKRAQTKGRALEVMEEEGVMAPEKTRNVPLVGQIAAGIPITADQNIDEIHTLPESLVGKGNIYMLKVKGDSMVDAAICDGDYVVIREQKNAEAGEIVAAMIDGEATVKTFSKKGGHFWLLPANDNYAPIPADNAEILGKVTAVLRSVR